MAHLAKLEGLSLPAIICLVVVRLLRKPSSVISSLFLQPSAVHHSLVLLMQMVWTNEFPKSVEQWRVEMVSKPHWSIDLFRNTSSMSLSGSHLLELGNADECTTFDGENKQLLQTAFFPPLYIKKPEILSVQSVYVGLKWKTQMSLPITCYSSL